MKTVWEKHAFETADKIRLVQKVIMEHCEDEVQGQQQAGRYLDEHYAWLRKDHGTHYADFVKAAVAMDWWSEMTFAEKVDHIKEMLAERRIED